MTLAAAVARARHAADWRFTRLMERVNERSLVLASGPGGRRLGSVAAVRSYVTLRELAERFRVHAGTVLYVGANTGQELRLLTAVFPDARFHCFEPQPEALPALRRAAAAFPTAEVHPVALSNAAGRVTMSRSTTHDQASSLRRPSDEMSERFPHVGSWTELEVDALRLDDWAADRSLAADIVLKLDVQGAEDAVLAGGSVTLERVRMVIVEVAVVPTYVGAPDLHVLFPTLLDRGFSYAGEVGQVRDGDGAVVEFDAVFVRPPARAPRA